MVRPAALQKRWERLRGEIEFADIGFLLLRLAALLGGGVWLLLTGMPPEEARAFHRILAFFALYGLFLYLLLALDVRRKKAVYGLSLGFDLAFVYLLIVHSGGFASSFFIGFYLLTALHSFYYDRLLGLLVAALCAAVYLLSGLRVSSPDWVDVALRMAFLFLIALPISLLSGRLRRDNERIESLNRDLMASLEETKRLQGKLIQAEKLSALGRLTSDVAHEIRNPLTAIGGFANRLDKRLADGTKEKEYAGIIAAEVARLERILKDILTFSRDPRHHVGHVDVGGVVAETGAAFRELCGDSGVALSVETDPSVPPCLIDRDQVRQALDNLVSNALDAVPAGGSVTLRTRRERIEGVSYTVIDVADTGMGIPAKDLERIFEPFYSTKTAGHGTGLGLSICKKIVEENRGLVRARSEPGKGSTFSLCFPGLAGEDAFRPQCWEAVRCGMEREDCADRCPAYPSYGRICWSVAGTLGDGKVHGVRARKIGDCRKCPFYLQVRADDEA